MTHDPDTDRRRLLALGLATAAGLVLPERALAQGRLAATPGCADGDEPTPRQTAGPFFTPSSPLKSDFRADVSGGQPMTLVGQAVTRGCRPVARALVDLWQADAAGAYDNSGYRLRGHQFADDDGRFRFETILPGLYPGRTRHFHVRVQAPNGPVLTTQLYIPGEAQNARDGLFRRDLLISQAGRTASFLFVVG